jgi:hypothetical protein
MTFFVREFQRCAKQQACKVLFANKEHGLGMSSYIHVHLNLSTNYDRF